MPGWPDCSASYWVQAKSAYCVRIGAEPAAAQDELSLAPAQWARFYSERPTLASMSILAKL